MRMFQVVLHFNRGTSDPDGDGNFDCIPAVDNFQVFHFKPLTYKSMQTKSKKVILQIISSDFGETWGPVQNISSFLKQ